MEDSYDLDRGYREEYAIDSHGFESYSNRSAIIGLITKCLLEISDRKDRYRYLRSCNRELMGVGDSFLDEKAITRSISAIEDEHFIDSDGNKYDRHRAYPLELPSHFMYDCSYIFAYIRSSNSVPISSLLNLFSLFSSYMDIDPLDLFMWIGPSEKTIILNEMGISTPEDIKKLGDRAGGNKLAKAISKCINIHNPLF